MDFDGAEELADLIKETDDLLGEFDAKQPFSKRVFAAHSESDTTADIQGMRKVQRKTPSDRFQPYVIDKKAEVPHASLVLKEPIFALKDVKRESPLETANPQFDDMMAAVTTFTQKGGEGQV